MLAGHTTADASRLPVGDDCRILPRMKPGTAHHRLRRHTLYVVCVTLCLAGGVHAGILYEGDGSDEPGFVSPTISKPPPPPPANISSAETFIPYPGPPVTPLARSEKKRPPRPPVMFTKIKSDLGPLDWATRPEDLNNLLKGMKSMIDVNFTSNAKHFREIDADPENNPILYRSGHFHFTLKPEERQRLRQYLLNGGFIIFNAGMGSKPFYDSAIRELREMFPETPVQRLAPDHPVFHAYYDLDKVAYRNGVRQAGYKGDAPWFEGVTINCRTIAVVSRWGMDIGWDEMEGDDLRGYTAESARKLGINLLSYATAQRAWMKNVARSLEFVDKDPTAAGKMAVAQAIYNGEWKTRHAGISVLLRQFNQKTEIPVKFARKEIKLSDRALFDAPLLYMTGHETFDLSPDEIANLRAYLDNGGFLLAEACCGRKAFDTSFRRAMQQVLPGESLAVIPESDALFAMPNKIAKVGVTPALAAALGDKSTTAPVLLGIKKREHYAVIYSPVGLAGGWEMSQDPYCHGYDNAGSLRLGENILMYGITQ